MTGNYASLILSAFLAPCFVASATMVDTILGIVVLIIALCTQSIAIYMFAPSRDDADHIRLMVSIVLCSMCAFIIPYALTDHKDQ